MWSCLATDVAAAEVSAQVDVEEPLPGVSCGFPTAKKWKVSATDEFLLYYSSEKSEEFLVICLQDVTFVRTIKRRN